jgi:hypothetical protein
VLKFRASEDFLVKSGCAFVVLNVAMQSESYKFIISASDFMPYFSHAHDISSGRG